jgi:group I intron endonuclease
MDYCGIYLIRNTVDGKVYVGQSVHTHRRWHEHKKCAKWGHKSHLYSAIRLYGAEAFVHELLEECLPEMFDEREAYWMAVYDCRNPEKGYNLLPAGQRGRVMDAETRERIASKLRGRKVPADVVARRAEQARGRKHTPETKAKIAASHKWRTRSPESAAKVGVALRLRWEAMTAEEREAYAEARRGFKHSEEARKQMSLTRKGKPKPPGFGDKVRAALLRRRELEAQVCS